MTELASEARDYNPAFGSAWKVCKRHGVTYRQLDYWLRCGLLGHVQGQDHGSGSQRRWDLLTEEQHRRIDLLKIAGALSKVWKLGDIVAMLESGELVYNPKEGADGA